MAKEIVVLQAGFVLIGDVAQLDGRALHITNASVIRRWGTTAGLGQIALTGPTKDTILDACGEVSTPDYIMRIKCVV